MRYFLSTLLFLSTAILAAQPKQDAPKEGYIKKHDPKTDRLLWEGNFKNNQPIGVFKYYHINDSVRAKLTYRGEDGKRCYARMYHLNGKRMAEGLYIGKEIKDSVWTFYDELGVLLSRETYKNGVKNGTCYIYFPDGAISEEKNWKNGKEHGPFRQYIEGKKIRSSGQYNDGKREGKFAYYYPNGVEAAAGIYKNDTKDGVWIYKKIDGTVTDKEVYVKGRQLSKKEADAYLAKMKSTGPASKTGTLTPETKPTPKSTPKTAPKKGWVFLTLVSLNTPFPHKCLCTFVPLYEQG